MDNQHGTARLAWLAGILDGEGSFMVVRLRRASKPTPAYNPRISIANTEPLIVDECKAILTEIGVRYCYYEQDKRVVGGRQRITLLLHVTNREGVQKLLEAVMPFLIGKVAQAKRLHDAVTSWQSATLAEREAHYIAISTMNRRVPLVDSSEAKSTAQAA